MSRSASPTSVAGEGGAGASCFDVRNAEVRGPVGWMASSKSKGVLQHGAPLPEGRSAGLSRPEGHKRLGERDLCTVASSGACPSEGPLRTTAVASDARGGSDDWA